MPKPITGTISGSMAAAVAGIDPYRTQVEVWQDIMENMHPGFNASRGYDYEPFTGNAATRWGHAFEDSIIQLAEQKSQIEITFKEMLYEHWWERRKYIGRGWIDQKIPTTCHLDGIYEEGKKSIMDYMQKPKILHEGKTTNYRAFRQSWGKPGTNRIPASYAVQVQHQMMCTGAEECIVSVLVFPRTPEEWEKLGWEIVTTQVYTNKLFFIQKNGNELMQNLKNPLEWAYTLNDMGFFHQYFIKSNKQAQDALKKMYGHFWSEYVIKKQPPPCRTYEDAKRLFVEPKGTIIASLEIEAMCKEYADITKEIGAGGTATQRKNKLRKHITEWMLSQDTAIDADEREQTAILSPDGFKLASFKNGRFRA